MCFSLDLDKNCILRINQLSVPLCICLLLHMHFLLLFHMHSSLSPRCFVLGGLSVSECLGACLSVPVCFCLLVHLTFCLFKHTHVYQSFALSASMSVSPFLPVCLAVLSIYLIVSTSLPLRAQWNTTTKYRDACPLCQHVASLCPGTTWFYGLSFMHGNESQPLQPRLICWLVLMNVLYGQTVLLISVDGRSLWPANFLASVDGSLWSG